MYNENNSISKESEVGNLIVVQSVTGSNSQQSFDGADSTFGGARSTSLDYEFLQTPELRSEHHNTLS